MAPIKFFVDVKNMNNKARATIEFSEDLWHEFKVYVAMHNITASKLIRNFVRKTLGKGDLEN